MPGRLACALVVLLGLSCGGQGPTAPRRPPVVPAHLAFAVTPEAGNRSVVDFTWSGSPGADRFQVEVGTLAGASDVAVIQTGSSEDSYRWTPAPIGTFFVRVRGESSGGLGEPSNEVKVASIDPRDLIEALFLASGPLKYSGDSTQDHMLGWIPGERIMVTVGSTLTAEQYSGVQQTIAQLPEATAERISGVVARTDDPNPEPRFMEITVAKLADSAIHELCGSRAAGCAIYYLVTSRFIRSVRVVGTDQAFDAYLFVHELGHAAFGFAHVKNPEGFRPSPIMAQEGPLVRPLHPMHLEASEVRASAAVYAAGLDGGARRADFEAAGLIAPRTTSAATARETVPWGWPGARVERLANGDLIVVKPFCSLPRQLPERTPGP